MQVSSFYNQLCSAQDSTISSVAEHDRPEKK